MGVRESSTSTRSRTAPDAVRARASRPRAAVARGRAPSRRSAASERPRASGRTSRRPDRAAARPGVLAGIRERVSGLRLPSGRAARAALVAAAAVAVLAAFLYGPTRDWYVAWRTSQVYAERLAELDAGNEGLEAEVNRLQSREGVEDEARKRGYVTEGETAATVEGLDPDADGDGAGTVDEATAADADGTGDADGDAQPWYVPVLDVVFGFDPESPGTS